MSCPFTEPAEINVRLESPPLSPRQSVHSCTRPLAPLCILIQRLVSPELLQARKKSGEATTSAGFNQSSSPQRSSNQGLVYTGFPPPSWTKPLCSPQFGLLSPQRSRGEGEQARLPNANSIMTSHGGGEGEDRAAFEVALLQETLLPRSH